MPFKKGDRSLNLKLIEWERQGDCMICTSHARNRAGYVLINRNGRRTLLSRMVCERRHGPLGKLGALHSCDNPACINPDHLRPGTQKDNVADMRSRNRHHTIPPPVHRGGDHWQARLTEDDVRYIRASKEPQKILAAKFGIDPSAISMVRTRRTWKHVT